MKPNGRRAWRRFAKQQRRKVNRRNRQTGTPWINDADGAFYRHEQKHFEQRPIVPVGPFTARSLVGMTMGARKRAYRAAVAELEQAEVWRGDVVDRSRLRISERLRPCPGCFHCQPGEKGWHIDKTRSGRFRTPALALACNGSGVLPAKSTKAKRPA